MRCIIIAKRIGRNDKRDFDKRIQKTEFSANQQPFIDLVDQILSAKKQGQDTAALEHQIDVMVYHLYELTFEEACVIDKDLSLEDFERFKLKNKL